MRRYLILILAIISIFASVPFAYAKGEQQMTDVSLISNNFSYGNNVSFENSTIKTTGWGCAVYNDVLENFVAEVEFSLSSDTTYFMLFWNAQDTGDATPNKYALLYDVNSKLLQLWYDRNAIGTTGRWIVNYYVDITSSDHIFEIISYNGKYRVFLDNINILTTTNSSYDSQYVNNGLIEVANSNSSGKIAFVGLNYTVSKFSLRDSNEDDLGINTTPQPDLINNYEFLLTEGEIPNSFNTEGIITSDGLTTTKYETTSINISLQNYKFDFDIKTTSEYLIIEFNQSTGKNANQNYALFIAKNGDSNGNTFMTAYMDGAPLGKWICSFNTVADNDCVLNGEWHKISLVVYNGYFRFYINDIEQKKATGDNALGTGEEFGASQRLYGCLGITTNAPGMILKNIKITQLKKDPFLKFENYFDFSNMEISKDISQTAYTVVEKDGRKVATNSNTTQWDKFVYNKRVDDYKLSFVFRGEANDDSTLVFGFNCESSVATDSTGVRVNINKSNIGIYIPESDNLWANWIGTSNHSILDNNWHQIDLYVIGGDFKLYIDGENFFSKTDNYSKNFVINYIAKQDIKEGGFVGLTAYKLKVEYDYFKINPLDTSLENVNIDNNIIELNSIDNLPEYVSTTGSIVDNKINLTSGNEILFGSAYNRDIKLIMSFINVNENSRLIYYIRNGEIGGKSGGYKVIISTNDIKVFEDDTLLSSIECQLMKKKKAISLGFKGNDISIIIGSNCVLKCKNSGYYYGDWSIIAENIEVNIESMYFTSPKTYTITNIDDGEIQDEYYEIITNNLQQTKEGCNSTCDIKFLFMLTIILFCTKLYKNKLFFWRN